MMPFDCYADNHSVPPKSRCPLEARESLPQSFHSLTASEPDPITLFTPYNFICVLPEQRTCHRPRPSAQGETLQRVPPIKAARFLFGAIRFEFNRPAAPAVALVPNQYFSSLVRTLTLHRGLQFERRTVPKRTLTQARVQKTVEFLPQSHPDD